jgi:hypothetical protein
MVGLSFYQLFTDLPVNYFYRFTGKLWLVKMVKLVKGKMTEQLFFNILFSKERKNERKEEKKLVEK